MVAHRFCYWTLVVLTVLTALSTLLMLTVSLLNTHHHTQTAVTQSERGESEGGHGEKDSPSLPPSLPLPPPVPLPLPLPLPYTPSPPPPPPSPLLVIRRLVTGESGLKSGVGLSPACHALLDQMSEEVRSLVLVCAAVYRMPQLGAYYEASRRFYSYGDMKTHLVEAS